MRTLTNRIVDAVAYQAFGKRLSDRHLRNYTSPEAQAAFEAEMRNAAEGLAEISQRP